MNSEEFRVGPFTVPYGRTGWICPKCDRGVSPDVSTCPYCPVTVVLSWGTATVTPLEGGGSNGPDGHSFEP